MSFLNQLKVQASALQRERSVEQFNLDAHTAQTEAACKIVWHYFSDLAKQLDVLMPAGPRFTLDGKTPWPAMKLERFRADARKKMLRNKEVFDYVGMGWQIVPQMGASVGGSVTVNFPPDLERVESRLAMGLVRHERKELRHPEKNTLQAIRFDYIAETRGNVTVTPDHDHATLAFRVVNASGFEVLSSTWPAAKVQNGVLDELAKLIVAQPSQFAQG
ncbi:MAG TPA: hypothetical protein VLJ57_01380 [Burkholderiaceae bacterium]|nr:hypothetical protein [Burkholderiaceae bacterium]